MTATTETPPRREGWHWTRRGWVRNRPKRRAQLTPKPPKKRRLRRQIVVTVPTEREKPAFTWRAPQIAQEAISRSAAPYPAAVPESLALRPPRAAWHGKYAALEVMSRGATIAAAETDRADPRSEPAPSP